MPVDVITFQKYTKPVERRKNHTYKHAEYSFKEHTFKEITSAIQTPIRELSLAFVLESQAINMKRVSLFIRQKDTNASVCRFHFNHGSDTKFNATIWH